MANVGPLQIFSNVTNQTSLSDVTRFLSAFSQQVATQFNNLLSTKIVSGMISGTGTVMGGSFFSVSTVTTSQFFVLFSNPFSSPPAVIGTPMAAASNHNASGVTLNSFTFTTASNVGFSFLAIGRK